MRRGLKKLLMHRRLVRIRIGMDLTAHDYWREQVMWSMVERRLDHKLLEAWGVSTEMIKEFVGDGSPGTYAYAKKQADAEMAAFQDTLITSMHDFARKHGLKFETRSIFDDDA